MVDEYGVDIDVAENYDPVESFSASGVERIKAVLTGEGPGSRLDTIFKYFILNRKVLDAIFNEILFILNSRQGVEDQVDHWFQTMLNRHSCKVVWEMKGEGFEVDKETDQADAGMVVGEDSESEAEGKAE
jgi:hypothetical protein